jgi:hypothetical protein
MAWREELSPSFFLSTNHPADQNESVVEKISVVEITTSAVSNENNQNAGAPGAGTEPVRTARDFGDSYIICLLMKSALKAIYS